MYLRHDERWRHNRLQLWACLPMIAMTNFAGVSPG